MADTKISALPASTTPLAGTEVVPLVQSSTTKQVSVANLTAGRSVSIGTLTSTNGATLQTTGANVPLTVQGASGYVAKIALNSAAASGAMALVMSEGGTPAQVSWLIGCNYNNNGVFEITPSTAAGGSTFSNPSIKITGASGDVNFAKGNLVQGTAAKGINFTANTPAAGMTSQLLNWYEEGTWTVTLYDASSGGNASATTATGYYTRIGRQVSITFQVLNINTTGMTAGNALFYTLPFTSNTTYGRSSGACNLEQFTFPAGRTWVSSTVENNASRGFFRASGSAVDCSSLTVASISTGVSDIERCSLVYFV